MSDSKLPQVKQAKLSPVPGGGTPLARLGPRQSQFLLVAGLTAAGAAMVLYFVSQHIFLSMFLAFLGAVFFIARQLVRKSIELTSQISLEIGESPVARLEEIRKQTSKCKFLENVEHAGTMAAEQAAQLVQQYKGLQNVLDQKFEAGELTRARYSDSIVTSCLAVGENLLLAKGLLENLNITKPKAPSPGSPQAGIDAGGQKLPEGANLWAQQKQQVANILDANAAALNELAALFGSLNQITTKEKYRDELEQSMQQIRALAERARQYSKQ